MMRSVLGPGTVITISGKWLRRNKEKVSCLQGDYTQIVALLDSRDLLVYLTTHNKLLTGENYGISAKNLSKFVELS